VASSGSTLFFWLIIPRVHRKTGKPSEYEPRGIWDENLAQWLVCRPLSESSKHPNCVQRSHLLSLSVELIQWAERTILDSEYEGLRGGTTSFVGSQKIKEMSFFQITTSVTRYSTAWRGHNARTCIPTQRSAIPRGG
jgi:hypothetical protein